MTQPLLDSIKAALIDLVAGMKGADTARMLKSMEQLDQLAAANREGLDPRLAHFLERRSYAKALDFLGGAAEVPAGTCAPQRAHPPH